MNSYFYKIDRRFDRVNNSSGNGPYMNDRAAVRNYAGQDQSSW